MFGDSIYTGKIHMDGAVIDQTNLLENMVKFNNKSRQKQEKVRIKNGILVIV